MSMCFEFQCPPCGVFQFLRQDKTTMSFVLLILYLIPPHIWYKRTFSIFDFLSWKISFRSTITFLPSWQFDLFRKAGAVGNFSTAFSRIDASLPIRIIKSFFLENKACGSLERHKSMEIYCSFESSSNPLNHNLRNLTSRH